MTIGLSCPSCGQAFDLAQGLFACPHRAAGEHALDCRLDAAGAVRAGGILLADWRRSPDDPWAAFSSMSAARSLAGDDAYAAIAGGLQAAFAATEGQRLATTPLGAADALAAAIGHRGPLLVKDETGQLAGSHKVRHLAGTMLYLEALRVRNPAAGRPALAISSCGNAALAAATVARAAGYVLRTFVPEDVAPTVPALLAERGARVEIVPRLDTGLGDPCYIAFRRAVAEDGCVPFSCSGRDNWANIDGGQSLGYETALQWIGRGVAIDHLVIQVGGGALARSVAQAVERLGAMGLIGRTPAIHVCQTEGAFPFVRAWHLLLAAIAAAAGRAYPLAYDRTAPAGRMLERIVEVQATAFGQVRDVAAFAAAPLGQPVVQQVLAQALADPAAFMWPWDGAAPHSLAHGILDDETYDWFRLAAALVKSGGVAVATAESLVAEAHALALAHTRIPVSPTGSSGLAGLLALKQTGVIGDDEAVALFFTGVNR